MFRKQVQPLVPIQTDFTDAFTALTTNRSTGRVNVGRGERIPYWAVGESHYQDALHYLRQFATPEGRLPALLVREPQAVASFLARYREPTLTAYTRT